MKRKFIILAAVLAMGLVGCDNISPEKASASVLAFFVCLFPGIECRFLTLFIAAGLYPAFFFYSLGCHPSHFHTFTHSHKIVCLS